MYCNLYVKFISEVVKTVIADEDEEVSKLPFLFNITSVILIMSVTKVNMCSSPLPHRVGWLYSFKDF